MIFVDWNNSDRVAGWVARRVPAYAERGAAGLAPYYALGVVKDGRPIAGLVFHNWVREERSIELTVASTTPLWFSPAAFRAVDEYTAQIGAEKLILWQADQRIARACVKAVGAKTYRIEELGKNLTVITRDAWRSSFMGVK